LTYWFLWNARVLLPVWANAFSLLFFINLMQIVRLINMLLCFSCRQLYFCTFFSTHVRLLIYFRTLVHKW
jgi:hypothetical protein